MKANPTFDPFFNTQLTELDIEERQRLEAAGILEWARVYGIEADRFCQCECGFASRLVITSYKHRRSFQCAGYLSNRAEGHGEDNDVCPRRLFGNLSLSREANFKACAGEACL
jgi:hypothetical protein